MPGRHISTGRGIEEGRKGAGGHLTAAPPQPPPCFPAHPALDPWALPGVPKGTSHVSISGMVRGVPLRGGIRTDLKEVRKMFVKI